MKAFDLHCHFNHNVEGDTKTHELYYAGLEFLKKERERLDIEACAMTTYSSVLSKERVYEENEYLHRLVQREDWLYQWVVVNPRDIRTYLQAEQMLAHKKVLGLKILCSTHQYTPTEYGDEIFAFANAHKATLLMHPDNYEIMQALANKYPNMKLIIAHLGSMNHINAVKNAINGNIYVDTSGIASSQNNVIEYAVQELGSDKIYFGTDSYACAFQKGRILFANITQEDKENILYKNALRDFPQLAVKSQ